MIWPFLALVVLGPPALVAYRSFSGERSSYVGQRHVVTPKAAETGIPGLRDIAFTREDGAVLRGWFAPGPTRAVVILTHGTDSDRSAMLPEARVLAQAGFGVLLFDWPGCGESEGQIQLGDSERRSLRSALEWLGARSDVDAQRIGAVGFSLGGYVTAQVAAVDPRIAALVLIGTPGDLLKTTLYQYRRWGALSQWPALLADRLAGARIGEQLPKDLVRRMVPRPVLMIGAKEDPVVPPEMVRELYEALPEPKELWMLSAAQHGELMDVAPKEYPERLVAFFRKALVAS